MKTTLTTIVAAIAATAGTVSTPLAHADTTTTVSATELHTLGSPTQLGDATWTITNLKPSSDTIPYHPNGTLWEATATDEATHGSTTPIVSNFNARARSGQTYRELFQVPTTEGINPTGLSQGQQASGKLYFDVTGDAPDSVTYNSGGPDLAVWIAPPPSTGGGSGHVTTANASPTAAPTPATAPAPVSASAPGSAGTVIPGSAQGTPLPPGFAPGGPQPPSAGTPAPAAPQTPAPAGPLTPTPGAPQTPAPAGPQTPAPGAPQIPAPGAPQPTPAPPVSGSQGTPLEPGTDQAPFPQQPVSAPAAATSTPAIPPGS